MAFSHRKVVVVGLGATGKATALFLHERGAQLTVSDVRGKEALEPFDERMPCAHLFPWVITSISRC